MKNKLFLLFPIFLRDAISKDLRDRREANFKSIGPGEEYALR